MTIKAWVASVVVVLIAWFSLQIGVMYFTDVAPGAMALFPTEGFISSLPENARIVDIGDFWIIVAWDEPTLGKRLYTAGALIVLPAGLPGCFRFS